MTSIDKIEELFEGYKLELIEVLTLEVGRVTARHTVKKLDFTTFYAGYIVAEGIHDGRKAILETAVPAGTMQ